MKLLNFIKFLFTSKEMELVHVGIYWVVAICVIIYLIQCRLNNPWCIALLIWIIRHNIGVTRIGRALVKNKKLKSMPTEKQESE